MYLLICWQSSQSQLAFLNTKKIIGATLTMLNFISLYANENV